MNHKILQATVSKITMIAAGIYKMRLTAPEAVSSARAGQFINIYPKSKETLLPRPISICQIHNDGLTVIFGVVGKGTEEFSRYEVGETACISTPLGNGFDIAGMPFSEEDKKEKRIALFGGGIGIPPMLQLAHDLKKAGYEKMDAVIGFKQEPFLAEDLEGAGAKVHVAIDAQNGTVLDVYKMEALTSDYAFACGPKPMLKALAEHFGGADAVTGGSSITPLFVSMEERMGCGYGACVGCVCRTKSGLKKVCTDGPVFDAREVDWNAGV